MAKLLYILGVFGFLAFSSHQVLAEPTEAANLGTAQGETLSVAIGHFARARSLLLAAIQEFDRGRKIARPDAVLDTAKWRATLVTRVEDLERLLDPQPRASTTGITYSPDTRLLSDAKK